MFKLWRGVFIKMIDFPQQDREFWRTNEEIKKCQEHLSDFFEEVKNG